MDDRFLAKKKLDRLNEHYINRRQTEEGIIC